MNTDIQLETGAGAELPWEPAATLSAVKAAMAQGWCTIALETDRLLVVKGDHHSVAEAFAAGHQIVLADHADLKRIATLHRRELVVRTEPFSHIRGYFPSLGALTCA